MARCPLCLRNVSEGARWCRSCGARYLTAHEYERLRNDARRGSNTGCLIVGLVIAVLVGAAAVGYALVVGGFIACASLYSPDSDAEKTPVISVIQQEDTEQTTQTQASTSDKGTIDNYYVEIGKAVKAKSFDDKDILIVEFIWKNDDINATNFESAVFDIAYQNGIQIESTNSLSELYEEQYNIDACYTSIQPGTTLTIYEAYVLTDNSPVTVEVSGFISFDGTKITKQFILE